MISSCKKHKLKEPAIIEKGDFVDVELFRPLPTHTSQYRTITDDWKMLLPEEKVLLNYLIEHKAVKRKQAVDLLNLGKTKTAIILKGLSDKNLIERIGQGRATYYKLINRGL